MAFVFLQTGRADAGATDPDGTTRVRPMTGYTVQSATESEVAATFRTANGTFDKAGVYVTQNDVSSASTQALRVNAASSALSISITGNTTGLFEDTTNSVTITAADKVNWLTTIPSVAGSHTISVSESFCRFSSATNTYQKMLSSYFASNTYGSTTVNYIGLGCELDFGTTEINVQQKFYTAGTLQKGFVNLSANTYNATITIKSRINGADGTIAISVTASTSGNFEDTTNTDAVASGNLINMSIQGAAGTGSGTFTIVGMEFTTTNNKSWQGSSQNTGATFSASTTYYLLFNGRFASATSTEAQVQYKSRFVAKATNLQCYVTANLAATNDTFDFRIGGVSSAITVSITALTTGLFEDAVNSATIAVNDLLNYRLVIGITAGTTISQIGCMIEDTTITFPTGTASWVSFLSQPYKDKIEMVNYSGD